MMNDEFFQQQETFAKAIQSCDLKKADAIDEKLMSIVGSQGRIDLRKCHKTPIYPLMWYSSNRAILRLMRGRVEEAALCMDDTALILNYSGLHDYIYFMMDCLAEGRGKHDFISSPFELACDNLMLAILCQHKFPAMALSFLWKSKVYFARLGHADIARFVEGIIGRQSFNVAKAYSSKDSKGSRLFAQDSELLKDIHLVVPHPDAERELEWPEDPFWGGEHRTLSPEERKEIFGQMNPHHMTLEECQLMESNWPTFNLDDTILKNSIIDDCKSEELPNILQVIEMLCYEEEKYALVCKQNKATTMILGDLHDRDGEIEVVVGKNDHYLYMPQGIINGIYYRGQSVYYQECKPSLYRGKSQADQLVERLKLCEFSILLRKHPSSKQFEDGYGGPLQDGSFESHKMLIDEEALAQHYGISTEYLDLTADKWVAAFFACTDYRHTPKGHRDDYVKHQNSDVGVLYLYQDKRHKKYNGELHPLGLQPFLRPVLQAGYVLKMQESDNFNDSSIGIRFRFDTECSSIVYWLFDQSILIQPDEIIGRKAKRIVDETSSFSRAAYEMAHNRYFSSLTEEEFMDKVSECGLIVQDEPIVDFTPEEYEQSKTEFSIQNAFIMRRLIVPQISTLKFSEENE